MFAIMMMMTLAFAKSNPKCPSAYCSMCDATQCTQCIDNYVLVNGECKYCREAVAHCQFARNGKCTACFDGYHLKNGQCLKNDPNCDEYENGVCEECEDGFVMKGGECVKCNIKGCEECSRGVDTCDECIDGYVFENGECRQPVAYCDEYNERTKKCEECLFGYRLENNQCIKIDESNCRKMVDGVCVQCFGPYVPVNGTCTSDNSQVQVIEHCIEYDDDGEFECEKCEDGYYTNEHEDECLKCDASCKTCEDKATECTSCAEGYYVNKMDKCEKCSIQSEKCSDFKSKDQCYQCNHKCNWYQNQCVESHCKKMEEGEADPNCIQCEDGYVLATTTFKREEDDDDDDDDDDAEDQEEAEAAICVSSQDGCKTLEGTQCVECHPGYFITSDFKCEKCSDNCRTCIHTADNCHSCFVESETLSESTCHACQDPHCLSCSEDYAICQQCSGNFTVGELGDCVMGCFSEDCDGKCTMCNDNQDNMNIYYPPTEQGVCLKYSQMPNTPDAAYPVFVFMLAFVLFMI